MRKHLWLIGFLIVSSTWAKGWKAGVAKVIITPQESVWQAGYASRTHASEGKLHDLWAKALALEDETGKKCVLVTTDMLGFPKAMSDRIRTQLNRQFGLTNAQIILNSSHTHSGPVLDDALLDIYPLDANEQAKINRYSRQLEAQVIALVGQALKDLEAVELFAQNGVTRFQVNRRNNKEGALREQTELKGPNDYAVPVIKALTPKGVLKAIVFGYACHPTVLDLYQFSGDFPGFAQLELEKAHPEATALFFQGAAGDQNPLPRRTVSLARQYGRELAAAVDRVLEEPMRPLSAALTTAYSEIQLPLSAPPTEAELLKTQNENIPYLKRWATRVLSEMKQGKPFITSYSYPLQAWKLGEQSMFIFGGELVIEYAIECKKRFGQDTFVMAYSNDVMGYIPSATILKEGGYEGASSQMVYGLPSVWDASVPDLIYAEVNRLAEQLSIPKIKNN
ncbi:neutral/alkaline non-lysosomal ceramidase N-terminal domain-containing protein [Runella salmonicolor]|uniref:Neutral/alkaline non-lysosomal ceramidase N-terminal domain-containing protein n=1 Tax=Runella salmonicolor TaxID=2950278 RepID=A0ABT1FQZ6_9BACT|nr:neutral/alkaline non-lysosomal ceramidase N-terminal domain-containing protein [Runella salmonicolor]MCP1384177.1 neutral/alkaline non-lysosomal ceramidase N-terminal domain-containing protein [Runella salmonicolor]